jgi:peptidoglycan hydrolase-like protein with peptidoglycan-binding domain
MLVRSTGAYRHEHGEQVWGFSMARVLNAIFLLLIGGLTDATAFAGDRDDGPAATPVAHPAIHRAHAAQDRPAGHLAMPAERVRIAQATGAATDTPPPFPTFRAVPGSSAHAPDASGPSAETRLAEAIQKELRRVGCYAGTLDGDWGVETRHAMKAFNDRVNASLPVDSPDYILLTLLQGHSAKACGASCPAGQALSEAGKCLPRSVIAEERRRLASERAHGAGNGASTPRAAVAATLPAGSAGEPAAAPRPQKLTKAEIRRQRLAAKEARAAAAREARAGAITTGSVPAGSATASFAPPPLPLRPSATFQGQALAAQRLPDVPQVMAAAPEARRHSPHKTTPKAAHHRRSKSRHVRVAARPLPPPTYRIGRLTPARPTVTRVFGFTMRAPPRRAHNPQDIFREVLYRMP